MPHFTRRRFLRAVGQGVLLTSLPGALRAESDEIVTISVLHTTDLHGHILPTVDYKNNPDLGGLARCVTQLRAWQRENPHHLLIDIGDVFQGTELGLESRGTAMIRCLNALNYDAWVIGNHEFDYGIEPLADAVQLSAMPVLSGNARIEGRTNAANGIVQPFANLRPYLIKEIAGFRIALISLTTPGLPNWIPPENLGAFEVLDPVESIRLLLPEVAAQKPDAIVLAGHMGLIRQDDFANQVGTLTRAFPQLTAFIGGHTHQDHSGETVNNVLYTQADHFGIHVGKLDLTFDRASRKLLHREATTVLMDHNIALDPAVLSLVRHDLEISSQLLAQPVGELTETFSVDSTFGHPSDVERLIGSAIVASLTKTGVTVDAVVHGLFDTSHPFLAGPKTVADLWPVLPYENQIVTIELSRADFLTLARDFDAGSDHRSVMGVTLIGAPTATRFNVTEIRSADGTPLPDKASYRIALNSYDSQSGGQRFLNVARFTSQPSSRRVLHPIFTRDSLIDFFLTRQKIGKKTLLV